MTYGSKGEERCVCLHVCPTRTTGDGAKHRANAQQQQRRQSGSVYFGRNFHMEIKHVPLGHVPARGAKEESVTVIKGAMWSGTHSHSLFPTRRGQDGCPSWPQRAREKNSRRPPP